MRVLFCKLFFLVIYLDPIYSQTCNEIKTCGECIGNPLQCVWCPDEKHKEPRCASKHVLEPPQKTWCNAPVNPQTTKPKVTKTAKFSSNIQFIPQQIQVKVRPGDTVSFQMEYKPALDYPIDVYYLMDNSYTMSFHKDAMTKQAQEIYKNLSGISNNVRFGVGTFIEKTALPYSDPDIYEKDTFTNRLALTNNIEKFVKVVQAVNSSGNYDIPEAALDALMQVMVCEKVINWRNEARRMVVLTTDAPYHSVGDGKAVGAYKRNDMQCHVINNSYGEDASLLYDYPSVSQINKVADEKDIGIIFAVLKNVEKEYIELSKMIKSSRHVELKNDNSSKNKLVELIATEYEKLALSLEIDQGTVPSNFDLKFEPACNNINKCSIPKGKSLKINAHLKVKSCPTGKKFNQILEIGPVNWHEKVKVSVEVLCECDCEKQGKINKKICNGGVYQCGVCKCGNDNYGKNCECNGTSTELLDLQKCRMNDTAVCSGRGDCKCGKCECWDPEAFVGDFCQIKNKDCPVFDNKLCGGNGLCKINKCVCNPGWNGTDCSCTNSNDACIGANSKECSGNGDCICGECVCKGNYRGTYCDSCSTCIEERCKELGPYVECYYKTQDKGNCDKTFDVRNERTITILNRTELKTPQWKQGKWRQANGCRKTLPDESSILFKYLDGRNSTDILIQKESEPPAEANIWIPIGSAIGSILLIGILSAVAWKVLVDIHDGREYKRFLKEAEDAGYDICDNPLYQPPAVNINNPAYSGKC